MRKVRSRRGIFGAAVRASLGPLAVALLLGCASGAKTSPPPAAESTSASAPSAASQAAPVQITSLVMREAAPGVRLELQATAPLVWTQYRDSNGNMVL